MKFILQKSMLIFIAFMAINQMGLSQCTVDAGTISTTDPTTICVDGIPDPINVTVVGDTGSESAWIITDTGNNILGTPPGGPFDLDGAGAGTCLIWYISHDGTLAGNATGNNISDLTGCFDLSNEITVTRNEAIGGTISTNDPTTICVDGVGDPIDVTLTGESGTNSGWVITDTGNNILGLPPGPPFDLDGAGPGTCLIWHLSYEDGLTGMAVGMNTSDFDGCFELSNSIAVTRNEAIGGTISTNDPTTICVDGVGDPIDVTLTGESGTNSGWVITDTGNNILGLPPGPPFDLDGAGPGTCLIWHLSYEDGLTGMAVGMNTSDFDGCFELSNSIAVTRNEAIGGTISTNDPTTICVDGVGDPIDVTLTGESGTNSGWVITDTGNNILGLPPGPPFDLDGAGGGTCLIWHLSYEDGLTGMAVGMNTADMDGCFQLSNSITVVRNEPDGGELSTDDETTICVDGIPDPIEVVVEDAEGSNTQWIITNDTFMILGKPAGPIFDLDGAGAGTCLIWHMSYEDGIVGDTLGGVLDSIVGCFDLSDSIAVIRNEAIGGMISTTDETTICVDGIGDPIDVALTGEAGTNSGWVITDTDNNILGLPPGPPFDLDGAGPGTCLIWHLSYEDGLSGMTVGSNTADFEGCFELSNSIAVTRNEPLGGTITTTDETIICVDGVGDPIDVTLTGEAGTNSAWVITDQSLNILGLPPGPPFDLDGAGPGTCLIWHLSFEDGLTGAEVGMNAGDLEGCFELSNSITVVRNEEIGGTITTTDETTICVDGIGDPIDVTLTGNSGSNSGWVITDTDNNILGLPPGPPFDLDGAGPGTCLIWHLSYADGLTGMTVGMNTADMDGCFELSNSISVTRNEAIGGTISTNDPTTICVDGIGDPINVNLTGEAGANSAWVITDENLNILGLPPGPPFDLDGAGTGVCLIWHLSFADGLTGAEVGLNAGDLEGCYELSNSIAVTRDAVDGAEVSLSNGETIYSNCPGNVVFDVQNTSENIYFDYYYVITNENNIILEWVDASTTSTLDLSAAPAGECHVWGWNSIGTTTPVMGQHISSLEAPDCEELSSNFITVLRTLPDGGSIALDNGDTEYEGCAGEIDFDLVFETSTFHDYWFVVTDDNSNILAWFNSDNGGWIDINGGPPGVCRIYGWNEMDLPEPVMGAHISSLSEPLCGDVSNNWVTITRLDCENTCTAEAATISTEDDTTICVDGNPDPIDVSVDGGEGMNSAWVITDTQGNILGLPPMGPFDLDGAGEGTCLIWYLTYDDVEGTEVGMNANDLEGCFALSNPITVIREAANGGTVALASGGTEATYCAGDVVFDVTHETTAENLSYYYIITDNNDNILASHNTADGPTLDLSGAPAGECHVWGWSYSGEDLPVMGDNISTLADGSCEAISDNFITINRIVPTGAEISTVDDTTICVDGEGDPITVDVSGGTGSNSAWVITDTEGNILGLPAMGPFDLDGAGEGVCLIWYLTYENVSGAEVGMNANDLEGCFALSNPITVTREAANGGTVALASGATEATYCAGEVVFDVNHETSAQNLSYWYIITDNNDNILGFHNTADGPTLDLSGAPAGECHVWGWSYKGEGLPVMGDNISTLEDGTCEAISDNFITITREVPDGGMVLLSDGTDAATFEAGDVIFDVEHTTTAATFSYWYIITDDNDNILAFHNSADGPTLDLSGAPAGECHIWGWSYKGLDDPIVGENISTLTDDFCEAISDNFITITRTETGPIAATIFTEDDTTICVDGIGDPINVTVDGGQGENSAYVITDVEGNILGLPPMGPFDLDGAGEGVCLIWHLNYTTIEGLEVGMNANDLTGEFALSNSITVTRQSANGGQVTLSDGSEEATFIAGDVVFDVQHETTATALSYWYIITDNNDNILAFHNSADGPTLDLSGAPIGECHIWGWSYKGEPNPVMGENISTLSDGDCEAISDNFIRIIRTEGLSAATISTTDETTICVDGVSDPINVTVTGGQGSNMAYVITDVDGNILGLPPMGPFDLDGAGEGVCLIWHLYYESIDGLEVDLNANDLTGEFALSNAITVTRQAANGGVVALENGLDTATYCVGGVVFDVMHESTATALEYWYVITDDNDNILAFHNTEDGPTLDLSEAPAGECHVWGWSSNGETVPVVGDPISSLDIACGSISTNFISIFRAEGITGGTISTESSLIACPNDGDDDIVSMTTTGEGDSYAYLLTDENDVIMGEPIFDSSINFEEMESGIARIYGLGYAGNVDIGNTIADIGGTCAVLSLNFIEVVIQETAECAVTSTQELDSDQVNIYPNPAVNFVTLEYTDLSDDAKVNVFDTQGRVVYSNELNEGSGITTLDVQNLLGGIYMVQVTSAESTITKRILITK